MPGGEWSNASVVAHARLLRIEDTRADPERWLDTALSATDAQLRAASAMTVGRIAERSHLPRLRVLASDADPAVSASALFALGLLKDTTAAELAARALRAQPDVSAEAAWLLGEIGQAGGAALLDAAADSSLGSQRRAAALLALARVRPFDVARLIPLLGSSDSALAWRAAYALGRARSSRATRALAAATRSPFADVRDHAARGLARSLAGDSLAAVALEALTRLASDSSARVRVTAIRVLAAHGSAAGRSIASALRDADPAVRVTAAPWAHLALDSTELAWLEVWRADTSFAYRRLLAESALRRGRLVAEWTSWRSDARWERRAAAVELHGRGSALLALAQVAEPLQDPDGRVRGAAVGVLAALADSAPSASRARELLQAALSDPDFVVRSTALAALAKGATPRDLPRAVASYLQFRSDRDADARLAFWDVVDSAFARAGGVLSDSVQRLVAGLPRPDDPLERARAARISRFAEWRDVPGTPRPASWYEARAREALGNRPPVARVETSRGVVELTLAPDAAPLTVHNFTSLARRGYFDGQRFHRVVPNFVVQGGDPRGDGNGGPGHAIRDELNRRRYVRGTLGMALSGPNTGGSQFFITHAPQPHLDAGYTVFGQLRSGAEVLDRIVQGDRIVRITIH